MNLLLQDYISCFPLLWFLCSRQDVLGLYFYSFFHFLPNVANTICWARMDQFWCNWHKWPMGQGHEVIEFGVRRSKVKVA